MDIFPLSLAIVSLSGNPSFIMPYMKSCPLKFGAATNIDGTLMEVPCCRDDCAWWFDNGCAVVGIAKAFIPAQKRRNPLGTSAD
jgi:hypothetical protein